MSIRLRWVNPNALSSYKVAIMGSSTANGMNGAEADDASKEYASVISTYFGSRITGWSLVKHALNGTWTPHFLPTGTTNAHGWPAPDTNINITSVINAGADMAVILLPSNDQKNLTPAQYIENLTTIKNAAEAAGVVFLIATPYPKEDWQSGTYPNLKADVTESYNLIKSTFPNQYIDLWVPLDAGSGELKAEFASGDGTHLNYTGQGEIARETCSGILKYLNANVFPPYKNNTGLEIHRSAAGGGTLSLLTTLDEAVYEYEDSTVTDGQVYDYAIRGVKSGSYSAFTPTLNVTAPVVSGGTIPTVDTNYTATGVIIDDGGGPFAAGSEADKAYDNTTTTFYDPALSANTYVGRDLGTAEYVNQVRILPRANRAHRLNDCSIQYSNDNTNWTTIASVTGFSTDTGVTDGSDQVWIDFNFTDTLARYWRVLDPVKLNVAELEFWYKIVSTNYSTTGTLIHDGGGAYKAGTTVAANAFDGDTATYYDPGGDVNTFVGRDLGSAITINRVRIFPRANRAYRLNDALIQYSTDGTNWTTAVTISGFSTRTDLVDGSDAVWINFDFAGISARYWRVFDDLKVNVGEIELWYVA